MTRISVALKWKICSHLQEHLEMCKCQLSQLSGLLLAGIRCSALYKPAHPENCSAQNVSGALLWNTGPKEENMNILVSLSSLIYLKKKKLKAFLHLLLAKSSKVINNTPKRIYLFNCPCKRFFIVVVICRNLFTVNWVIN